MNLGRGSAAIPHWLGSLQQQNGHFSSHGQRGRAGASTASGALERRKDRPSLSCHLFAVSSNCEQRHEEPEVSTPG